MRCFQVYPSLCLFCDPGCNDCYSRVGTNESRVSTIVVRGSTDNYMDDIERAIDDGVNVFKGICKVGLSRFPRYFDMDN